jgi:hypothetical protein
MKLYTDSNVSLERGVYKIDKLMPNSTYL